MLDTRILLAALASLVLALGACGGDDAEETSGSTRSSTAGVSSAAEKSITELPAEQIAKRVEQLRGESFKSLPEAEPVSSEESAEHFAEMSAELPARELLAIEEELKLIGAIPPETDLGDLGSTLGGDAALGFYESPPPRIALVAGPTTEDPKAAATIFAHEATHALDDQYFDIFERLQDRSAGADAALAFSALVEGDATSVELAYTKKYGGLSSQQTKDAQEQAAKLPFALQLYLDAVYGQGTEFVAALVEENGPEALADAFEDPPVSSAQILHPELYFDGVEPTPVGLAPERVFDDGWTLLGADTFGEVDVVSMLVFAEDQFEAAEPAAEGWRGGRFEVWREGPVDAECPLPCISKDALVIGLDWETPTDADEFESAFATSLEEERGGEPVEGGAFELEGGGVAFASNGAETTVAYAPTPELASELSAKARP